MAAAGGRSGTYRTRRIQRKGSCRKWTARRLALKICMARIRLTVTARTANIINNMDVRINNFIIFISSVRGSDPLRIISSSLAQMTAQQIACQHGLIA
jgi:hypothetical protein